MRQRWDQRPIYHTTLNNHEYTSFTHVSSEVALVMVLLVHNACVFGPTRHATVCALDQSSFSEAYPLPP